MEQQEDCIAERQRRQSSRERRPTLVFRPETKVKSTKKKHRNKGYRKQQQKKVETKKIIHQRFPIGTLVLKAFEGYPDPFAGHVVDFNARKGYYRIVYEDYDCEEVDAEELAIIRVDRVDATLPPLPQLPSPLTIKAVKSDKSIVFGGDDIHIHDDGELCLFALHGIEKQKSIKALTKACPGWFPNHQTIDIVNLAQFFLFMSERQRMWQRRKQGKLVGPWSTNYILQRFHWCNNYRELDRGTQYFRAQVLKILNEQTTATRAAFLRRVLFASYIYRQCNRIESFEAAGGIPSRSQDHANIAAFFERMAQRKQAGQSVMTGAHQTGSWHKVKTFVDATLCAQSDPATKGSLATYQQNQPQYRNGHTHSATNLLEIVCRKIESAGSNAETILQALQGLSGVGSFLAWQIYCDLQESRCIEGGNNNLCLLGPGAKKGILLIFPQATSRDLSVLAQILATHHQYIYDELGVSFQYWRGKPLGMKELEHALCEFSKFHNIKRQIKQRRETTYGRRFRSRSPILDSSLSCETCSQLVSRTNDAKVLMLCDTCGQKYCLTCDSSQFRTTCDCDSSSLCLSWVCRRCLNLESMVFDDV